MRTQGVTHYKALSKEPGYKEYFVVGTNNYHYCCSSLLLYRWLFYGSDGTSIMTLSTVGWQYIFAHPSLTSIMCQGHTPWHITDWNADIDDVCSVFAVL